MQCWLVLVYARALQLKMFEVKWIERRLNAFA
jgi:hypothetical protein